MSQRMTKKRQRDVETIGRWRDRDRDVFARIGLTLEQLAALQYVFRGQIVAPGDPGYDKDRLLFNPVFNPFPSLIAYCTCENDVRLALNAAWGSNLPCTIRSGGHSTAGYSASSGMLIDVSQLNDVFVNPLTREAIVGCGTTFGKLNAKLDEYGLHVPGGECDDVCIGGYMQGGGYGFTSRAFGMNCDNVIEVRVMLADGRVVTANEQVNRDLWWAVRGGTGGNFGVLLSVRYRLHKVQQVWGWALQWPLSDADGRVKAAGALLILQQGFMRTGVPKEMTAQGMICYQGSDPNGSDMAPYLLIRGMFLGSKDVGEPLIGALGGTPQYQLTDTYVNVNNYLLGHPYDIPELPPGSWLPEDKEARYVARDLSLNEWRAILDFMVTTPNRWSYMCLELYGGAINGYPLAQSAFIHRDVAFSAFLDVFWQDDDERPAAEKFLRDWCELLGPMWNGHIYQNYPSAAVPDYRWNYWGGAYATLAKVKQKYDPDTFFSYPQSILQRTAEAAPAPNGPKDIVDAIARPIEYS